MANYIFLPIASHSLRVGSKYFSLWFSHQMGVCISAVLESYYESGWKKGIARRLGHGCLKEITSTDTLYIMAHGYGFPGFRRIVERRDGDELKSYNAEQLANVLFSEGLRLNFRNLHLLSCGSGLMNKSVLDSDKVLIDSKLISKNMHKNSFARQVCDAMKIKGYSQIQVTGYLGNIHIIPAMRPDFYLIDYFTGEKVDLGWKVVCM